MKEALHTVSVLVGDGHATRRVCTLTCRKQRESSITQGMVKQSMSMTLVMEVYWYASTTK